MNTASQLWSQRLSAHLRIVSRYMTYAAQSGFFLFLFGLFLASSFYYGRALERLPDMFPYSAALVCWLTPFIAVSPIRTLLREADLVLLLPLEARMGPCFRGAVLYSFVVQAFAVTFAVAGSMPLYRHGFGPDTTPFAAVLFVALALKLASLLGAWMEGGIVHDGARLLFRTVRWLAAAAIVLILLRSGFEAAAWSTLGSIAAYTLAAYMVRPRLSINWLYLRRKEIGHQTTMLLFFNWFTDVPDVPSRVKPRKTWSRFAGMIRFAPRNGYLYLYALVFLRSELYGILLRLTAVAAAILCVVSSGWIFAAVFVVFQLAANVQLSALGRMHAHSVWPALYPMPDANRTDSAAKVAFAAQMVQTVLLTLPMLRPTIFNPWMLGLPVIGIAIAWAFRRSAKRTKTA